MKNLGFWTFAAISAITGAPVAWVLSFVAIAVLLPKERQRI